MKNKIAIILIVLLFLLVECTTQKKVLYEFPITMGEDIKAEYIKQFDKGKILYDINCSKCHNTKVRRKVVIPDFTPEQLVNYEMRIANPEHIENIPEMKVAEDELAIIMTFLRYKKKNR